MKYNIGLYKPFFNVYFKDDKFDMNAVSYEVVNVAKIFADNGHIVDIISGSDLDINDKIFGDINKNSVGFIKKGSLDNFYDRIILYGGLWNNDKNIIVKLRNKCDRLDFMLTDIRVMPEKNWMMDLFDNFYSQSTNDKLFGFNNVYGGVAEFRCYNMKLEQININIINNKGINMYFGGTTRNRLEKYKEYIWNNKNDWVITGKSDDLNFNNRVTRDLYLELLKQTKYSLTFVDVDYEENNFVTPRHYENIENNIVSFVDNDWDKAEKIMKLNDWRRVKNYGDLKQKINFLNNNIDKHLEILLSQQREIKNDYINGDYVYNILK